MAIDIQKTVYLGHDGGVGCPGGELATAPAGSPVTYCFVVKNTGGTYLDSIALADLDLGITEAQLTLLSGSQPLAPGATLAYYYEASLDGALLNTATVSGTPTDPLGTPIVGLNPPMDADSAAVGLPGDVINVCAHACLSKLLPKPRGLDRELIQLAVLPVLPMDPESAPFHLTISNALGVIYDEEIPAGSLERTRGESWIYKNRDARLTGGLAQVKVVRGVRNGNPDVFRISVKAFGELANLGPAEITVTVSIGNQTFFATTTWSLLSSGWVTWLPQGLP